jgi:hypothetical protein
MKDEIKQHQQEKVDFLKFASVNCHSSMKAYYQGELYKWRKLLKK